MESYIAVPLNRRDGSLFGTLCALDTVPANLNETHFDIFHLLSQLISFELEAEEERHREAAQRRALEDFVSVAVHDLRQPLTALYGRAQLLQKQAERGADASQLARQTNIIVEQTRRMVRLSDTVLDMARIEAGQLSLNIATFDMAAMCRHLLDELADSFPAHRFVLDSPPTLEMRGDEARLSQVARNLLDNAAKYTPPGSGPINLTISQAETEQDDACVILRVRDAGPGVAETELGRIFDRRYRAQSAGDGLQTSSGSGLGLYISQQIVNAHGGQVWAERAPGGGLVVTVLLPHAGYKQDAPQEPESQENIL